MLEGCIKLRFPDLVGSFEDDLRAHSVLGSGANDAALVSDLVLKNCDQARFRYDGLLQLFGESSFAAFEVVVEVDSSANEERLPDVRYQWRQ